MIVQITFDRKLYFLRNDVGEFEKWVWTGKKEKAKILSFSRATAVKKEAVSRGRFDKTEIASVSIVPTRQDEPKNQNNHIMIYAIPIEKYPKEGQFIEELKYHDENDFEWRLARVMNGVMIRYFGDSYFKENTFECELNTGETIRVKNTNCIFVQDETFDTFFNIRNILKTGYTDDIWETLEELFTERLNQDKGLLESELV